MPVRYDQDTKDDYRKEQPRLAAGRHGRALQRGMEWVMCTAAGLLSGAPRPMNNPDAIRATVPFETSPTVATGAFVTTRRATPATVMMSRGPAERLS
jgi:hypothetical protein